MRHRMATVGMIGACMLSVVLVSRASANEFYAQGSAQQIQGADDLGKTFVHYLVTLGFPALSAVLIGGGLMSVKRSPGAGGAGIGAGLAAGWAAGIVNNIHSNAAATVWLASAPVGLSGLAGVYPLLLQAALTAYLVCAVRGRFRVTSSAAERGICGNAVEASLTNP